jgi:molecular chaperone GrpE
MNPFKRKDESSKTPSPAGGAGDESLGGAEGGGGSGGDMSGGEGVDETAALIDQLQAEIEGLRADQLRLTRERDEAQAAWKHALADFQNFQRRASQNEQTAREQGVRGVLHSVVPVVDHFEMALSLNPEASTAKQVIDGVSMIKDELVRALELHGVRAIRPAPGEAFDASAHKAIGQQPVPGVQPGSVALTVRIGYMLDGRVVRPAEVLVAAEPGG